MFTPTEEERKAFVWMQGRMVELLLRHDTARFDRTFGEFNAEQEQLFEDRLGRHRDLAVLFYLKDELFNHILPRIKRRLSFAAPREITTEEGVPRGKIDWGRTAAASWEETPGEVPLTFHTRQRHHHFATPENLLTVVTLVEYRTTAQTLLTQEEAQDSDHAILHPLHEILEAINRELVFPQFAGLLSRAEEIVAERTDPTPVALVATVHSSLQPGHNSAYSDLLAWREKLQTLRLLDRLPSDEATSMLGADPARDNYLYQLWLFYELGDFLTRTVPADAMEWDTFTQQITFAWGETDTKRTYKVRHDQGVATTWNGKIGLRPDFYIVPADRVEVTDGETLVWQESGFMLDAKYYRPTDSENAPTSPVKRMIADLTLSDTRYGALLFAFHGRDDGVETALLKNAASGTIRPNVQRSQRHALDTEIQIHRFSPTIEGAADEKWHGLLNTVHHCIGQRVEVRCHGVFVDNLTATAHGELWGAAGLGTRNGESIAEDDLVICPKPHIGLWRVDLVRASQDCCKNAAVCHIKGVPNLTLQPPRRLQRLDDVIDAIQVVGEDTDADERVRVATKQVKVVVERYADLLNPDLNYYRDLVKSDLDFDDFDTTPLLTEEQRKTLALARFLWDQIDRVKAENYAGPVLLFTGVLEEVIAGTMGTVLPVLKKNNGDKINLTLGTFGHYHVHKKDFNYTIVYNDIVVGGHWDEQVAIPPYSFEKWLQAMSVLTPIRNKAGHHAKTDKASFSIFEKHYMGSVGTGYGVLSGLLLVWR